MNGDGGRVDGLGGAGGGAGAERQINVTTIVNPDIKIDSNKIYYSLLTKKNCLIEKNYIPYNVNISDYNFKRIIYQQLEEFDPEFYHFIVNLYRNKLDPEQSYFTSIRIPNILIEKIFQNQICKCQFGINIDETVKEIKVFDGLPDNSEIYKMYADSESELPYLVQTPVLEFMKNNKRSRDEMGLGDEAGSCDEGCSGQGCCYDSD